MKRRRRPGVPLRTRIRRPLARAVRPVLSLAVLTVGLLLSGAFVGVAVQQTAVAREARMAQQGIDAEQGRRTELQGELAQRKTDTYVVDKARELGYVRPGEGLIAVQRAPEEPSASATVASTGDRLARWIALFFGGK